MSDKRFELSESVITDYRIYDYKQEDAYFISCTKHTAECLVNLLNSLYEENKYLKKRFKAISDELYCKDRKLEELEVPIECCDKDEG